MIADFIATGFVILLSLFALLFRTRNMTGKESQISFAGFGFHILCGLAIGVITQFFYGGDAISYHRFGIYYSDLLSQDFGYYFPQLLNLLFKRPSTFHFTFIGSATGSMQAVAAMLTFCFGGSFYAACMFFAMLTLGSQLTMYNVFKSMFPKLYHQRIQLAMVFMPSVGFWASGLLKESVAFVGFGPFFWGASRLMVGKQRVLGLIALFLGMGTIALVKSYILFPLFLAWGVAIYWYKTLKKHGKISILRRPWQLGFYGILTMLAVLGLGELFPKYSLNNIGEEAANLQYYGNRREGIRSNYVVGNYKEKSLAGQVLFMPIGLSYALFRPFPFEIRNAAMALNVLEMMFLFYLWFRVLMIRPPPKTLKIILSHPLLMFCLIFVLLFGASVGIATTNLGTLSRYRMPMMPFYALLLLILERPLPDDKPKRVKNVAKSQRRFQR